MLASCLQAMVKRSGITNLAAGSTMFNTIKLQVIKRHGYFSQRNHEIIGARSPNFAIKPVEAHIFESFNQNISKSNKWHRIKHW